jgi:hypothetical protein
MNAIDRGMHGRAGCRRRDVKVRRRTRLQTMKSMTHDIDTSHAKQRCGCKAANHDDSFCARHEFFSCACGKSSFLFHHLLIFRLLLYRTWKHSTGGLVRREIRPFGASFPIAISIHRQEKET